MAKFFRRSDLNLETRLFLAVAMNGRHGNRCGFVDDLARRYKVSTQFLYDNQAEVMAIYSGGAVSKPLFDLNRMILSLRLECNSSISGIVATLASLGYSRSVGYISELLRDAGAACVEKISIQEHRHAYMSDEVFANGRPILAMAGCSSHFIYLLELVNDRTAETWSASLKQLLENGVIIEILAKDQGTAMKAAAKDHGIVEQADLFHLLHPFDKLLASIERQAYASIIKKDRNGTIFLNRKTETTLRDKLFAYEASVANMNIRIRECDNYTLLHDWQHELFNSFNSDGSVRSWDTVAGDCEALLQLWEEAFSDYSKLTGAVRFLRSNIADYKGYIDRLEEIVKSYQAKIPLHSLKAACLAWQLAQQSVSIKDYRKQRKLKTQSNEYLTTILSGHDARLKTAISDLFADLSSNPRSSSPLEAKNSIIRSMLDTCRGQVTQETLNLLAFFLNHRKARRGKYAGKSPFERLTGKEESISPIDLILERLRSFRAQQVEWEKPESFPASA